MTSPLSIRTVYNFQVYPSSIIPTEFKNVTVLAIMDRDTASKEIDTEALHVQVYPFLPSGIKNDSNSYDYVKIKTNTGNTIIIGMAWIKEDTIEVVTSSKITIVVSDVSASDVTKIRNILVQSGYTVNEISIN